MAITYKCFGQTNDNTRLSLFNGREYKVLATLVKQLNAVSLPSYEHVIIQKIEVFPSGEKSVLWPMGQKTDFRFDVKNGNVDAVKLAKFVSRNGR